MQLDDLKAAWAAHGAMLERILATSERMHADAALHRVRRAFTGYVVRRALEVALGIAVLWLSMPVLVAHLAEPRYVVSAGALAVLTVALLAQSAYLLVAAVQLDYGGPVTAIQRDVEHIRLAEYRALKWAVLGGVVVWLPGALVLFEALTGVVALARVELPWLAANLLFGLVALRAGLSWSKRHVERTDSQPWARRLREAVSDRAVRQAADHLAEIARFGQPEQPGQPEPPAS